MTGERLKTIIERSGLRTTIAAALDVPDDVISQVLGHAARNSTTAIYIERSQRKVDEANRRVIDFVLKG